MLLCSLKACEQVRELTKFPTLLPKGISWFHSVCSIPPLSRIVDLASPPQGSTGVLVHPSPFMSLVHYPASHQVKGLDGTSVPDQLVWKCSLSQVTSAGSVVCPLSVPGAEYQLPGRAPPPICLLTVTLAPDPSFLHGSMRTRHCVPQCPEAFCSAKALLITHSPSVVPSGVVCV